MATPTQVTTKETTGPVAPSGPSKMLRSSLLKFFSPLSFFLCLLATVPQEPDPFYYDYDTVQTVGMTLATILFLLGILIVISKKVKCRKADSRSESPTCKSCKSELPSSAPGGGGV
ncbi:FXYD domain-containing ion transport regulator 7 isoform X1 [Kogia breviceps]|uniref:FXYD domain-containing ion transport regulator 7 isoform X1 n=1 Tax=Kogia breviceps TaxID=27615 RepID=UPI0034D29B19